MLEGLSPKTKARPCATQALINSLDEKDKKILIDAINDSQIWSSSALSKALKERGIVIADHSITKHRNKICVCSRD